MNTKTVLVLLAAASSALAAPVQLVRRGNLPTPVSASTALSYLDDITTGKESNSPAYERSEFHTWINIEGNCNTRGYVLKRDGSDVEEGDRCVPDSGTWFSDYDAQTFTASHDLDIDHLVPLKEAWVSGAKDWTSDRREQFANDVTRPQLLAVSASANRSKGDQDIAEWLPRSEFQCEYVRAWVQVKHYYGLEMDDAEKQAARDVLNSC